MTKQTETARTAAAAKGYALSHLGPMTDGRLVGCGERTSPLFTPNHLAFVRIVFNADGTFHSANYFSRGEAAHAHYCEVVAS